MIEPALCLPDVTWHHCMWWDLSCLFYCICRCTVATWLFSLYTSPGWEILPHEKHPRKGGGMVVENSCTFLIGKISQAALKMIKRWWKTNASIMACIPFFSRWNCVHITVTKLFDFEAVSAGDRRKTEWWINCRAILKLLLRFPQSGAFSKLDKDAIY